MNSLPISNVGINDTQDDLYRGLMHNQAYCACTSSLHDNSLSFVKIISRNQFDEKNSWLINKICYQPTNIGLSNTSFLECWMKNFWMWAFPLNGNPDDEFEAIYREYNFETYKQLRQITKEVDPSLSKEEIYEMLLKPFRHQKVKVWSSSLQRFIISYDCKYSGCGKKFTKIWNLLDHVRMHEGIKPYECKLCNKTFTQKGNFKKHNIIQHSDISLSNRKKFECSFCSNKYTERYNLTVSY